MEKQANYSKNFKILRALFRVSLFCKMLNICSFVPYGNEKGSGNVLIFLKSYKSKSDFWMLLKTSFFSSIIESYLQESNKWKNTPHKIHQIVSHDKKVYYVIVENIGAKIQSLFFLLPWCSRSWCEGFKISKYPFKQHKNMLKSVLRPTFFNIYNLSFTLSPNI